MITKEDIRICVDSYQKGDLSKNNLKKVLVKLADWYFDQKKSAHTFSPEDQDRFTKEAASLCADKLSKFDSSRGVAFNFCATIIGCYWSQVKPKPSAKKLKEIFNEYRQNS